MNICSFPCTNVTRYVRLSNIFTSFFYTFGAIKFISRLCLADAFQVCLRWAIQNNISVIPKSSSEKRIKENFDIFNFTLSAEEMKQIDGLDRNWRIVSVTRDNTHKHYPFNEEY